MRKMCKDCDHEPVCGSPHTEHTLGCNYWQAKRVNATQKEDDFAAWDSQFEDSGE